MIVHPHVPQHPVYTVTLAQIRSDNSLRHDLVVTTCDHDEALRVRNGLNKGSSFLGSKRIAQLIRREVRPRQWRLLAHVSARTVHLRCAISHARGILCNPTWELIESLKRGHALSGCHPVSLQSERVQVSAEGMSLRDLTFTALGGIPLRRKVVVREPVVNDLDISLNGELINDNNSGVIARHPIDGDTVTIPERFARALWSDGIALPLRLQKRGKVLVRLADPELRSRLSLARLGASTEPVVAPPRTIPTLAEPLQTLTGRTAWSGVLQPV